MEPAAKVIADSVSPLGDRLTTIEVVMHRFVLAEFNTHRVFSRNSASSRAIPVHKQIKRVQEDLAFPVAWPAEKPGMQGGEPLSFTEEQMCRTIWEKARTDAVEVVERLLELGLHKSVTNRLLEPFMWHTVICTATEWSNFWGLRCNPLAQPEMRVAAEAMKEAYEKSTPEDLDWDQWHMPYINEEDRAPQPLEVSTIDLRQVSSARCARVSLLTHDGTRDIMADVGLFDRLSTARPMHASPFEHVATPCRGHVRSGQHLGNFVGWDQYRHQVDGNADH